MIRLKQKKKKKTVELYPQKGHVRSIQENVPKEKPKGPHFK